MQKKKKIVAFLSAVSIAIIVLIIIVGVQYFKSLGLKEEINKAIGEKIKSEEIPGEALPHSIQYSNAVLGAIHYEVMSCDQKNETAVISFSYVDAIALADQYGESVENIDEFYIYCVDSIMSKTAPVITKEVQVQFALTEEIAQRTYVIQSSPELADVLTGGTFSEYLKLIGGAD